MIESKLMLKLRIQHLLEVKSAEEHRNLTIDDLAEATKISRSALYKMNTDPHYNPSKDVLEKLMNYFQCTLDDLFDRTTRCVFDLPTAFPAGETLPAIVISLLAAANDMVFLRRMELRYTNESEDGNGINKEIRHGEKTFISFLRLGFLQEGITVFRHLLQDKTAIQILDKLGTTSRNSFEALKREFDGKNSLYTALLKNLRNNVAFHYLDSSYSNALLSIKQQKGYFIIGRTAAETRFLIADDIRAEVFRAYINFDIDNKREQNKIKRINRATDHLVTFSHGFLRAYLDHHQVKIEEF